MAIPGSAEPLVSAEPPAPVVTRKRRARMLQLPR